MHGHCHRCGGELPAGSGESPFCPHCGAPQLFLSLDLQSPETGGETAPGSASTGTRPPPRPRQVDWQMAIRCSAIVAGVAAVLSVLAMRVDALSPFSTLWIMSGSLITLGLYQRRRPLAWMDMGTGAKIGVVAGLCLAAGLAVSMAAAGLVARYGLHTMGAFDAQITGQILAMQKQLQQSPTPATPETIQFLNSPEFRGGMTLGGYAMLSAFLLALSTVGGAFAGLLRMRRKTAA